MSTSTVNYRENFFLKPYLAIILSIPTYDDLHQVQLKLESNYLSVQSNLGGGTHRNIGFLMNNLNYSTLSPVAYVRPVHPGIL